ncbi:hypothetical protein [Anaerotignum propionicum]|uniref:hypothetical protein n=1 Tax=Anaerotignum propionicum TaxID=28446 RepID=UPI0013565BBD|nr:hypothetical protein [Anaerotignum propionicum]
MFMSNSGADSHFTGMSTVVSTHSCWATVVVVVVSGFSESCTEPSLIGMAIRTVAVSFSGNSKSSVDVLGDTFFSVSASGTKLIISPLVSIGVCISSAIADTGSRVITIQSARNILSILFIESVPP